MLEEEIHKTVQDKVNELFQDSWEVISIVSEAATKVLGNPTKCEVMDAYLLARQYTERKGERYKNMKQDYKNIVNEIVAQFNMDCAERLKLYAHQAMQHFNDHFAADNGISLPVQPDAAA